MSCTHGITRLTFTVELEIAAIKGCPHLTKVLEKQAVRLLHNLHRSSVGSQPLSRRYISSICPSGGYPFVQESPSKPDIAHRSLAVSPPSTRFRARSPDCRHIDGPVLAHPSAAADSSAIAVSMRNRCKILFMASSSTSSWRRGPRSGRMTAREFVINRNFHVVRRRRDYGVDSGHSRQ